MNRNIVISAVTFIIFMLLQVFIFKNLVLFNTGFCFIYLIFLLILPLEAGFIIAMISGLVSGLIVDVFYDTPGIHAAANVFIMFVRPYWIRLTAPRGGLEVNKLPTLNNYGLPWFIRYAGPLILAHSMIVFFIEAAYAGLFWLTLSKTALTTVISLVFIVTMQYLFYTKGKS